ncbi:putative Tetratricopeptide repeat (TPR)-like superfamily protein [Melia azedarach]|uniref:Tetratricopeptide repeat (TPR)-like superfamily protein n=1 Tax=Melia azedarach TaxID=155640 RepID=A0ACC1XT13_MELAZ|nr:putative Tetratricopeptide repeat (TPR)-like superfamily protein [Melia azedarach]
MATQIAVQIAILILTLAIFYSIHYVSKQTLTKIRTKNRTTVQTSRHLAQATSLLSRAKSTPDKSKSQTIAKHALTEVQMALSLDPKDPQLHIVKARILEFKGHESSALKSIDLALNLPRVKLLALKERGEALVARAELKLKVNTKRRVDSAVEDLKEAVRVSEGECNFKALCLLSECYTLKGLKEDARKQALEEALSVGPGYISNRNGLDQLGL